VGELCPGLPAAIVLITLRVVMAGNKARNQRTSPRIPEALNLMIAEARETTEDAAQRPLHSGADGVLVRGSGPGDMRISRVRREATQTL
jgi:hypothetical protein